MNKSLSLLIGMVGFMAGLSVSLTINALAQKSETPALKLDLAYGQCRYGKSPDGMWWQSDQENHSIYKDNCGEIGVSRKFASYPAFGWSVRYITLGRAHTRAIARTSMNDDYRNIDRTKDGRRAECQPRFNDDNCDYLWSGDGGASPGLNFALNADFAKLGAVTFEGEIGAYFYRMKWSEQIFPMGCHDGGCPWRNTVEQKTGYYISPMAGLTAKFPIWDRLSGFVATRYYFRTSQHVPISAGVSGPVQTWLVGLSVSFK